MLEAMAAGVPYLQPAHGAFPEMHSRADAGRLFDPERPGELADRLAEALADVAAMRELGERGRQHVLGQATTDHEAQRLAVHLQRLVSGEERPALHTVTSDATS